MALKKVLIVGDSFAASNDENSWTNLLSDYDVTVCAMSGASEYRLLKAFESHQIDLFDCVIFVHTSPNRIYIEQNPYYKQGTHKHCDLLYADIKSRLPDKFAKNVCWWFENVFDIEHAQYAHRLLFKQSQVTNNMLHITFFDIDYPQLKNWHSIWQENKGTINHMNINGNQLVASNIKELLS